MRLKTYIAPTMTEAMSMVRRELGDDAIIVSTQRSPDGDGMRIIAASEVIESEEDFEDFNFGTNHNNASDEIKSALQYHRILPDVIDRILNTTRFVKAEDNLKNLTQSINKNFSFAPFPDGSSLRPFIIVGCPGSGKTNVVAKLAARGRLSGYNVGVITADTVRAGAAAQLSAFTEILQIELNKARGPESLSKAVFELSAKCDFIYIDSPGVNPFNPSDMDLIQMLAESGAAEPVLVMPAGIDAMEAVDIASAFSEIGAVRVIATKLDLAKRFGAIISAVSLVNLAFCEISTTPHIASGLSPINAKIIAQMLLNAPKNRSTTQENLFI